MTFFAADAFFYQGIPRWAFGLDNPNKAAAVLAFLLLLLLAAALRARREWACWCWSSLAGIVGYGLVHTFSRGGLVASFAGALVLLAGSRKVLCERGRWLSVVLVACVLVGASVCTGFAGRIARSSPSDDASVGNRLAVWRNVPSMMVDAPGGWGHGASGDVFMGWYQPLDRHERYRTLVSSHFTWLTECGWAGRLALVWAWLLAFGIGGVRWRVKGDPLPLAVWISFATAALFSSVAESWIVGVLPAAMLVSAIPAFWTSTSRRLVVVATLVASGLILTAFVVLGVRCRPKGVMPLHRSLDGTRLVAGDGKPDGWIVYDAETMGGATFGRRLRRFAQTPEGRRRAYGFACDLEAVPTDARQLVLCGRSADVGSDTLTRFPALADMRVLSPSRPKEWLAARREGKPVRVFCGELAASCPAEDVEGLTVLPGVADYLPDWPRLAFGR